MGAMERRVIRPSRSERAPRCGSSTNERPEPGENPPATSIASCGESEMSNRELRCSDSNSPSYPNRPLEVPSAEPPDRRSQGRRSIA
jgi:hypothetical protein